MSADRDSLDPETRARYDEAIAKAAQIYVAALRELQEQELQTAADAA